MKDIVDYSCISLPISGTDTGGKLALTQVQSTTINLIWLCVC